MTRGPEAGGPVVDSSARKAWAMMLAVAVVVVGGLVAWSLRASTGDPADDATDVVVDDGSTLEVVDVAAPTTAPTP